MIEIDNEAQAEIDAEEEAVDGLVDNVVATMEMAHEDAASETEGDKALGGYLLELEKIDRQLQATETEKSEAMKLFNTDIKDLKKSRAAILKDIEAYRQGERGLDFGE